MIRNFLFHRVNPSRDRLWDPMDVDLFDACIKHISSKYEVRLFEELVTLNKLSDSTNYATIMFDDGYKDNIEYALPILNKYKCKASFYVVTNCIDRDTPTWTHILEHSFQNTKISEILIDFEFLPTELHLTSLNSLEDRITYVSKLKPLLKKLSHTNRNEVLNRISVSYTDIVLPKLMMNWDDLRKLRDEGHYIGSHTVTHCMLGTMSNNEEISNELLFSGKRIEEELGYFPITISYPVGSYNDSTIEMAKSSGYKIGLAVKQNVFNPKNDSIFEVPRIELYNEPWWKTRLRISNVLEQMKSLIRYK